MIGRPFSTRTRTTRLESRRAAHSFHQPIPVRTLSCSRLQGGPAHSDFLRRLPTPPAPGVRFVRSRARSCRAVPGLRVRREPDLGTQVPSLSPCAATGGHCCRQIALTIAVICDTEKESLLGRADLPAALLGEPVAEANRALLCAVGLSPEVRRTPHSTSLRTRPPAPPFTHKRAAGLQRGGLRADLSARAVAAAAGSDGDVRDRGPGGGCARLGAGGERDGGGAFEGAPAARCAEVSRGAAPRAG